MFEQLVKDAQPKAASVKAAVSTAKAATSGIFTRVMSSHAVQASKALGYRALVNTVGVSIVLAEPITAKAKNLAKYGWTKVEELAAQGKAAEKQLSGPTPVKGDTSACPSCGGARVDGICKAHGRR